MYKEILADHTSMHALRPHSGGAARIPTRANELLQLVEYLLLADVIWVCDTVTPATMRETLRFYNLFVKHGLASPRSDGAVRIAQFTTAQILAAVQSASALIRDTVVQYGMADFDRLSADPAYGIRPAGAQPFDFQALAAIPFGSSQAQDYIYEGLKERGWKTAALSPLMSAPLHLWLQGFVSQFPNPSSAVYSTLNTIMRWRYNEQLAMLLAKPSGHAVDYVPAVGRAKSIEQLSESSWAAKLRRFEQESGEALRITGSLHPLLRALGATIDYPLPLLGAWAVSQLKSGASLDDLVEKISCLRNTPEIVMLKGWLLESDSASVTEYASELRKRLNVSSLFPEAQPIDNRLKRPNPLIWSKELHELADVEHSPISLANSLSESGAVYAVSTILSSMDHGDSMVIAEVVLARVADLLTDSGKQFAVESTHRRSDACLPTEASETNAAIPSTVSDSHIFRRTSDGVWELRFPGDGTRHFPHRKGMAYIQELLRANGQLIGGAQLAGKQVVEPSIRLIGRKERTQLAWKIKLEEEKLAKTVDVVQNNAIALSLDEREILDERIAETRQKLAALRAELQSLNDPDQNDPLRSAAHAAQAAITRALKTLKSQMPLLADHLGHCRSVNSNSFRYDPGVPPPVWRFV